MLHRTELPKTQIIGFACILLAVFVINSADARARALKSVTVATFHLDGTGLVHPDQELPPSKTMWLVDCKRDISDASITCMIRGQQARGDGHFTFHVDQTGAASLRAGKQPEKESTVFVKIDEIDGLELVARDTNPLSDDDVARLIKSDEIQIGWKPWAQSELVWQNWPMEGFANALTVARSYATNTPFKVPERIAQQTYFTLGRIYQQMEKTLMNTWCIRAFGETDITSKKSQVRSDMLEWFEAGYRREFRSYTKCEIEQARVKHMDWALATLTFEKPVITVPANQDAVQDIVDDPNMPPVPDHKPLTVSGHRILQSITQYG